MDMMKISSTDTDTDTDSEAYAEDLMNTLDYLVHPFALEKDF
jgi:hypothetical protein